MSLRSIEGVYEFLAGQHAEAIKHDSDFDRGRESALKAALSLLARVDSYDIEKLHEAILKYLPLLLIVPWALIGVLR